MRKLILPKNSEGYSSAADILMSNFRNGQFVPNHNSARFSSPGVSAQRGFYQCLNGVIYVCIEICPDIANPLGGGATVSFTSGDTLTAPIRGVNPQTYISGDWLGLNSFVMTDLVNGTKYNNLRIRTNTGTGLPEILINHSIGSTAATFMIEGFYISKVTT
jgi:hypothetical protein